MSRTDGPGLAEAAVAMEPASSLSAAIDRVYPDLRRTVEILVLKAGLGRHADEVTEVTGEVLAEAAARPRSSRRRRPAGRGSEES